jgi:hypothetical protein
MSIPLEGDLIYPAGYVDLPTHIANLRQAGNDKPADDQILWLCDRFVGEFEAGLPE